MRIVSIMMHPELSSDCNVLQWQAVTCDRPYLLITSGPGTGKTHTLAQRIAYWNSQLSVGHKMVAMTFTLKAAEELRTQINRKGLRHAEDIFVGTFHQYYWQLLRQHAPQWQEFQIVDQHQLFTLAGDIWTNLTTRQIWERLDHISRWKSVEYADPEPPGHVRVLTEALRAQGWLDYDDVLCEAYRLLRQDLIARDSEDRLIDWFFVDEYQDINAVQHALLKIETQLGNRLTVIGDPDQSIYGFRGADIRYFNAFEEDFPGAEIVRLEENYRSATNIIQASRQMINAVSKRDFSESISSINNQGRLVVHESATDKAEAQYVVDTIKKIIDEPRLYLSDSGRKESSQKTILGFGDFTVLFRLQSQAQALSKAFDRSGIPYHIVQKGKTYSSDDIDSVCPVLAEDREYVAEKVTLMTIHAAKGLEFPAVFVVGCEQNLLPLDLPGLISSEDEERRLFYVAMTRSREYLFLTYSRRRFLMGQELMNSISPFVLDIEPYLWQTESGNRLPKCIKTEEQLSFL